MCFGATCVVRRAGTGGRGGGGFKGLSASERRELDEFTQERMDRRTALMQAMEFHTVNPTSHSENVLDTAGAFYKWLRKFPDSTQASAKESGQAGATHTSPRPSATGAGAARPHTPAPASQPSGDTRGGEPEAAKEDPGVAGEGTNPDPPAVHVHTFTTEPFVYDGNPIPVRKGFEVCTGCLDGRKAA